MASGANLSQRLGDIGGKEDKAPKVPIRAIAFYPDEHALGHPRRHLFNPVPGSKDRRLVDSMKRGYRKDYPLGCRERGRGNPLGLVCGSRRFNACIVAERELIEEGRLTTTDHDDNIALMIPVVVRAGSDLEMLAWRVEENSDDLAEPDTLSVLSATFRAMEGQGMEHDAIATVYGHGYTAETVETLCRMPNLYPSVVARFDSWEIPLEAMAAVLDEPHDEAAQLAMCDSIMVPLDHLPEEKRTKRRVKAAIKEATRDEPAKDRVVGLPRKKLERVWEAVEKKLDLSGDKHTAGESITWEVSAKMLRFVIGGDPDALEGLSSDLIATVTQALAKQKPGRKSGKKEADGE